MCKFGRDRAICVVVEAICAESLQTYDGQTDDGRRAIVLAHGNKKNGVNVIRCGYGSRLNTVVNVNLFLSDLQ